MQRLEVSGAVRPIYGSLGVKRLNKTPVALCVTVLKCFVKRSLESSSRPGNVCVRKRFRRNLTELEFHVNVIF